jgi:hypothetical protein
MEEMILARQLLLYNYRKLLFIVNYCEKTIKCCYFRLFWTKKGTGVLEFEIPSHIKVDIFHKIIAE